MMSVLTFLYLFGLFFCIGFMLASCPPHRDGEGYVVVLLAMIWPVLMVLWLYYRLSDWVRYDLGDWSWA